MNQARFKYNLVCLAVVFISLSQAIVPVAASEPPASEMKAPANLVTNSPQQVVREFYKALNRNDVQPPDVFEADLKWFVESWTQERNPKGKPEQIVWVFLRSQRSLLAPCHPSMEDPFLVRVTDFPNSLVQGVLAIGSSTPNRSVVRKQILFTLHLEGNRWRISPLIHVNGSQVIPGQQDGVRTYLLGEWMKEKPRPRIGIESPKAAAQK